MECYHVSRVDKHPKPDKFKSEERCLKMKKYSKEFKSEALILSDEIGVKKAAAQLGIQYYTIADWRKNRKAMEVTSKPILTDDEMRIRNSELERENAELKRANDEGRTRFFRKRPEEVKTSERHLFVREFKEKYTVKEMCKALKISEPGYYC
jgi:transposase